MWLGGVDSEAVWAFLQSAENAPYLDSRIIRGYSVPGTGPGVGERQCNIRRCAEPCGEHEVEFCFDVTELDDEHVVYVSTTPPPTRTRLDVLPEPGGVRLTWSVTVAAKVDEAVLRAEIESMLRAAQAHLTQDGAIG